MGRTKQTARVSTGGKAPRKQLASFAPYKVPPTLVVSNGKSASSTPTPKLVHNSNTCLTGSVTAHVSNVRAHLTKMAPQKLCVPPHWADMNGECKKMINIDMHEEGYMRMEWENVTMKFEKTLPSKQIVSIHRLQNTFVWDNYVLRRSKMEEIYGKGFYNELSLFHGTTPDSLDVITEQNLDPRLAGNRTGAMLGKGTYFATTASYSDSYSKPDDLGHKYMFLCKVLAGNSCLGRHDYNRPPAQFPGGPLFDSCYNNETAPSIYCIFHDSQYYPEYLIEYI